MRSYRIAVLAAVTVIGAITAPAFADTPASVLETSVIDSHTLYCAAGDTCSFDQSVSLADGSTMTSLSLDSATVPPDAGSAIDDARAGFRVLVAVPAKARSVEVTFQWSDVTGSAAAIGGSWLTGFNQAYVILIATSAGCTDCVVLPDDGSGPDGSGNAILLASSAKPTGNIDDPAPFRTVRVRAERGYLPSRLSFSTFFVSNSYLSEPGRVTANYKGRLAAISVA